MATGKKKQDEINLKILRELTSLDHNKKCLECGQRGITYADMTTAGFVCVQCSGYLRGLNPPHRVKSISMTSFADKELELLKDGGNEVARKVWLGTWNPSKDREPDKKEEQAFKEFLITKYERRQWYKSPGEVKREEETTKAVASSAKAEVNKIQPPPSSRTQTIERPQVVQATPQVIQVCTAPVTHTTSTVATNAQAARPAAAPKVDLLGDLEGDPFAAKKPVGGVAVFGVAPNAPLLPSNGPVKQDEFGAFTSALSASSSTSVTLQPSSSGASGSSAGDKYADLKSLDYTFRELRLKDEPSPQLPRADVPPSSASGGIFGTSPGPTNPFVSPQSAPVSSGVPGGPQTQSNPFMVAGGQPQGVPGVGGGGGSGGWVGAQGAGFPPQQAGQMQGGFVGAQMQQQPQQQQQQQPQQQQRFMGQGNMMVGGAGGGAFNQQAMGQFPQQQQQQQWGGGMPQQQGQQQGFMMMQQGGGGAGTPQMQWGGAMQQVPPQQRQQVPPQQRQQWGAQQQAFAPQQAGVQFGAGMQQQGVPGGYAPNMQQSQANQFGGFVSGNQMAMQQQQQQQQAQQQQQQQKQANQFDWSGVNASLKQKSPHSQLSWDAAAAQQKQQSLTQKKYINWGGGATRLDNSSSGGSLGSGSAGSGGGFSGGGGVGGGEGGGGSGGWSEQLAKPVSSGWGSQVSQQSTTNSMGWSTGFVSSGAGSSGMGVATQQQGGGANWASNFEGGSSTGGGGGGGGVFGQQSSGNMGFGGMSTQQNQMGGANPFASAQSGPTNPFL